MTMAAIFSGLGVSGGAAAGDVSAFFGGGGAAQEKLTVIPSDAPRLTDQT